MIDLRTGTPGACKTLSAVEALAKMIARWEKHPDEARPVYVHGVKDLALPHSPVPLVEWRDGNRPALMVPDWDSMADGAYVLVDEAQGFFPPRSTQSTPPPHVAWLNTHRHRGFDITVITQHPKLIDGAVRALVGKHQHFRRLFGGARAMCYEWDACSDSLSGLANAVTSYYPFPKHAFKWYKSAEVHTKQRFKIPKWVVVPFVGLALGVWAFPKAYSQIMTMTGHSEAKAALTTPKQGPGSGGALAPTGAPAPAFVASAAVAQAASSPASAPVLAGCMVMGPRCECIDTSGKLADTDQGACRANVGRSGLAIAYTMTPGQSRPVERTPVAEPALGGPISLGGDPRSHILKQ